MDNRQLIKMQRRWRRERTVFPPYAEDINNVENSIIRKRKNLIKVDKIF